MAENALVSAAFSVFVVSAMSTKSATKEPIASKTKVIKPVQKNATPKKAASDKGDGLRVLKQVLHLSRILDDHALYEVTLSGEEEHKTVKSSEWLSLLHDTLARLIARIIYARETSKA